jgi:hypothetical protein
MAIKKTIEIDVNSQGATSGINNVTNSIEQTDKATKSLKAQLKEATLEVQKLADEFGATSKEVIEASKRAADLKDRIEDANDSILAFKGEGAFNATAKALGSVASGFSAVEGAIVLAGGQSEEFQQTMLKLQGAMALAQGLEGLEDAGRSFKQLGAVAKNALAGIRTGIAATGIGVLLIALGAVVAYWDDIKEAVNGVSDEQEQLNAQSKINLDSEKKKLDAISAQENTLKAQGLSERDILKLKIQQTDQVLVKARADLQNAIDTKATQIEAAKRNQDILAGTLKFLSLPLTMILKTVDAVGKALGKDFGLEDKVFKGISSLVFDPIEVGEKADAAIQAQKDGITKLINDQNGFKNQVKAIDKQAATDAAAKQKEANDKEIELAKQKADALERIRQGEIDTEAERRAEELRQVKEQYKQLIAEAEKYYGENSAKVLSLKEAQRTKEKELADKFKAEDEQKELDYWTAESEKSIKRDADKKATEDKKAADDVEREQKRDAAIAQSKDLLNKLSENIEASGLAKSKAGQAVAKGIALTQIGIDSAVALSKASTLATAEGVAAQVALPFVPGIGTVARIISYASTGLSVLSNIKRAKQLLSGGSAGSVSNSGGGSSSGGGQAATPAPQFNVVGTSGVNQLASTLGQQQPVQAFVVANQVTTQQSLDRNIVQNASLG